MFLVEIVLLKVVKILFVIFVVFFGVRDVGLRVVIVIVGSGCLVSFWCKLVVGG